MSSPARTPGRRSKRGRADEMSSELDVPSPARSSRSGKSNTPKRTRKRIYIHIFIDQVHT